MDSSRSESSHEDLLDRFEKFSLEEYGFLQTTEPNSIIASSSAAPAAVESKGNGDGVTALIFPDRVSSYCSSQTESKPDGGKLMGPINSATCDKDCYKCVSPFMCDDSSSESTNTVKNVEKYSMCDDDCYKCWPYGCTTNNLRSVTETSRNKYSKCDFPFTCEDPVSESINKGKNIENYYPMCDEDCYKCWPFGCTTNNLRSVTEASQNKYSKYNLPFTCEDSTSGSVNKVKNIEKDYPMCDEDCYKCWPYGYTMHNLRSVTETSQNKYFKRDLPFTCEDSVSKSINMGKNIEKYYPMCDEDCYKCFPGGYCGNTTQDPKSGSGASRNKYSKKSSDESKNAK